MDKEYKIVVNTDESSSATLVRLGKIVVNIFADICDKQVSFSAADKGTFVASLLTDFHNDIMNELVDQYIKPMPSDEDGRAFMKAFISQITNTLEQNRWFYSTSTKGVQ